LSWHSCRFQADLDAEVFERKAKASQAEANALRAQLDEAQNEIASLRSMIEEMKNRAFSCRFWCFLTTLGSHEEPHSTKAPKTPIALPAVKPTSPAQQAAAIALASKPSEGVSQQKETETSKGTWLCD
jgi:hypothetical protein